MDNARTGEWHGTALWGYHAEREKHFLHSDAITDQRYVFFHLKSLDFHWDDYRDLKPYRIGANNGYNYHKEFESAEKRKDINVIRVETEKQLVLMLLKGRIDIALMEMLVAHETMRNHLTPEEFNSVTFHPHVQSSDGLHLLISKKAPESEKLVRQFNLGLTQLKQSGKLDQYLQDAMKGEYKKLNHKWNKTVRLTTGEYPPFLSQHLKHNGVGVRIIKEAFALEGLNAEFRFYPWARAYHLVKKGDWDASATWAYKEERAKEVLFSAPLYQSTGTFFHLKSFPLQWKTLSDLRGIRIGATRGYTYTPDFWNMAGNKQLELIISKSDLLNFRLLLAERIKLFPINTDVGYALLNQHFSQPEIDQITHHPKAFSNTPTHVVFSRSTRSQYLVETFNRGLEKLKASGKVDLYFQQSRRGEYEPD